MRTIFSKLYSFFLRIYADVKYPDIWSLKGLAIQDVKYKHLYYNRLKDYGSWIGVNFVFDDIPIFPHGYFGIFVSNEAKIGKNSVIYQHVTIGSNTIKIANMKAALQLETMYLLAVERKS